MLDPNPTTRITSTQVLEHPGLKATPPEIVHSTSQGGHTPTWIPHRRSMNARLMVSLVAGKGRELSKRLNFTNSILTPGSVANIYQDFRALVVSKVHEAPPARGVVPFFHPVAKGVNPLGFQALLVKEGVTEELAHLITERVFSTLDKDSDGVLTWKEFVAVLPLLSDAPLSDLFPENTLKVFWDCWAEQQIGGEKTLCPHQLRDMLTFLPHMGREGMEETVSHILETVDINHDNAITFEEFLGALHRESSASGSGAGAMASFKGFSASGRRL